MRRPNTKIDKESIIRTAQLLRSEHGENPEYDRALVELVSYSCGYPMDVAEDIVLEQTWK